MTYRLLSTGRGVPLSLTPEAASPLNIVFEGAPAGANVYVKTRNGAVYYREIRGGKASIDLGSFAGEVELGVVTTDVARKPSRWTCGYLTVWRHISGVICTPSVADLAERVKEIALENEELRAENAKIINKLTEFEKKFNEFYEGYDVM